MIRPRLSPLLGACLLLCACLQPVGFPWADSATTTTTGDPTTTLDPSTTTNSSTTTTLDPSTTTNTSTTTTGPSTSSTTAPAPVCGDGALDPDEECDDGDDDDDDGCNTQCGRDRLIFVTDAVYSGDQIGGIDGGDALCRAAAQAAGLPRPLTFKTWLSDQVTDARDRLYPGKGRYRRVDGLLVADSWPDLLDGELENPIVITETDAVYEAGVWTGTRSDGTRGVGANHCEDWTLADAFDPQNGGFYGFASEFDELWTFVPNEDINPGPCGGELAIYCIEQ